MTWKHLWVSLQVRQTMNAADEAEAVPIYSNPINRRIPVSFPWENTIRKSSPNQVWRIICYSWFTSNWNFSIRNICRVRMLIWWCGMIFMILLKFFCLEMCRAFLHFYLTCSHIYIAGSDERLGRGHQGLPWSDCRLSGHGHLLPLGWRTSRPTTEMHKC